MAFDQKLLDILPFVSVAALSKDAINFISLSVCVLFLDWLKRSGF